jgi:hypothetical protein
MATLLTVAQYASAVSGIVAAAILLIRPLRERLTGAKDLRDGLRCQLRSDMLRTYYKHLDTKTIRQFEMENFILEYKAYKALKGNSFIDIVEKEVKQWEVKS